MAFADDHLPRYKLISWAIYQREDVRVAFDPVLGLSFISVIATFLRSVSVLMFTQEAGSRQDTRASQQPVGVWE